MYIKWVHCRDSLKLYEKQNELSYKLKQVQDSSVKIKTAKRMLERVEEEVARKNANLAA